MAEKRVRKVNYVDRISDLPPPILHKIMELLGVKDLTKTMVLSKFFMFTWTTFPVLKLDYEEFHNALSYQKSNRTAIYFFKFVDYNTHRRKLDMAVLQKFELRGPRDAIRFEPYLCHINKVINFALENRVKDLSLSLRSYLVGNKSPYCLPRINCGQYLKILALRGFQINFSDLILAFPGIEELDIIHCFGLNDIKFSSNKIKLFKVRDTSGLKSIDIESTSLRLFECFAFNRCEIDISRCSRLEMLAVMSECVTTNWVEDNVTKLFNLKNLGFERCDELESLRLSNENLKSLYCARCPQLRSIDIRACRNLEALTLIGFGVTSQFLQQQVSNFAGLRHLKLDSCSALERIDIVHLQKLETLELSGCSKKLVRVNISTPKLVSFKYGGPVIPLNIVTSETPLHVTLSLDSVRRHLDFVELRRLIALFAHSKTFTIACGSGSMIFSC